MVNKTKLNELINLLNDASTLAAELESESANDLRASFNDKYNTLFVMYAELKALSDK